ncbi:MAG: competence protein ComEC [Gaiellales bacterium]|nr:competence protein ComEC [Gaiellales bacterium]
MWRCDPATRFVLAALAGLTSAAFGRPLLGLVVAVPWRPRALLAATALLAAAWGGQRVADLDHRALRPGPIEAVVVVTAAPSGDRAIVRVASAAEDVLLVARGQRPLLGGVYRAEGRLQPPDPAVRGYYATQGVHLELRASRLTALGMRGGGWSVIDRLHAGALGRLAAGRDPSPQRALVAGVTLGDTSGMSLADREAFRASGLYHLVAVSGQNVALVVVFALACLALLGVIGTPARLAAIALTLVYVLVTGAGPSIVRAGVAGGLVSVAWLASRPVARWHLVACGAAVVLALNPLDLFNPGFQLSFAAVAAIFLVAPRLQGVLGQAAAVSVACTLVTTPIAWWHFGRLAPLSVPANLLALPAVAPLLVSGLTAIVLGSLWPPLAGPPLWLGDLLAGYLLWVAHLCS